MMTILFAIRSPIVRFFKPKEGYWLATKSVKPLSRKFGFDRGTPIDRYWIETFIKAHEQCITGVCLEVGDNRYTRQFGKKVTKSDILDVNAKNTRATIHGDLRNVQKEIKTNTYDCIVLTHVLGMIDDYDAAISECKRILKPGGTLLVTVSSLSPTHDISNNFWRFTKASAEYVFAKAFGQKNIEVKTLGNVLAGQAFWVGLAQEELTRDQLGFNDPAYPCIVTVKAKK